MLARGDVEHLPPLLRLASVLTGRGHEVDVYTARAPKGTEAMRIGSRVIELAYQPGYVPGLGKLRRELDWNRAFLAAIRGRRYDVIVANNLQAVPATWLATRAGGRFVYHCHELLELADCSLGQLTYLGLELLARDAALVVCPDALRAERLRRRLGQMPMVVHNAMPLTVPASDGLLRARVAAAGHDATRLLLYQGGMSDTPELRAAIDAAGRLPAGWTLVLLGWSDAAGKELLRRAGPRIFVHPKVRHEDLWPLVSSADVGLVLYSNRTLNERLAAPNKLGEYLMAGLAVAFSPCESLDRLLDREPFARAVDVSSGNSLVESLRPWFDDATLDLARRQARAYACARYNYETEVAPLVSWIEAESA